MTIVADVGAVFRTNAPLSGVDRAQNVILGAALMQLGPVNDDRPWDIDRTTLEQLVEFGNRPNKGIKSRFTHPDGSSDGMGKHLGRYQNFRIDGDTARADLHMAKAAMDLQYGKYVMAFAEEDPELFGNSPHVVLDMDAMRKTKDPKTGRLKVRIKGLQAVDIVDAPAATRTGLFSKGTEDMIENTAPDVTMSAALEKLNGTLETFAAKISNLEAKLSDVPKQVEEARFAEQKRLAEINGLFASAGMSGAATEFFTNHPNGTVDKAREIVLAAMLSKQGGAGSVAGGSNDDPAKKDPDATFKKEYADDREFFVKSGTSEADYILSRRITESYSGQPLALPKIAA